MPAFDMTVEGGEREKNNSNSFSFSVKEGGLLEKTKANGGEEGGT